MLTAIKTALARRKLAKLVHPRPEYRERRLAQFSPERRERYAANIAEIGL